MSFEPADCPVNSEEPYPRRATGARALLLVAVIIWGLTFVIVEPIEETSWSHLKFTFLAFRFLLAALLLAPIVLCRPAPIALLKKCILPSMCIAPFLTIFYYFQTAGLFMDGKNATTVSFATALSVVFVPVLARLFLREETRKVHWIAWALGSIGVGLMAVQPKFRFEWGGLVALIGSFALAFDTVLNRLFTEERDPFAFTFTQCLATGAILLFLAFMCECRSGIPSIPRPVGVGILYTACFGTVIAYAMQLWAMKFVPAVDTSIILCLEPIVTAIASTEEWRIPKAIGCALILCAVCAVEPSFSQFWSKH